MLKKVFHGNFGSAEAAIAKKRGKITELYTWKADFSQLRNQRMKPNMAEIEGILMRQF